MKDLRKEIIRTIRIECETRGVATDAMPELLNALADQLLRLVQGGYIMGRQDEAKLWRKEKRTYQELRGEQ